MKHNISKNVNADGFALKQIKRKSSPSSLQLGYSEERGVRESTEVVDIVRKFTKLSSEDQEAVIALLESLH